MSQTLATVGSDALIAGFFPYRGRVLALIYATMLLLLLLAQLTTFADWVA